MDDTVSFDAVKRHYPISAPSGPKKSRAMDTLAMASGVLQIQLCAWRFFVGR
ncbi:MAG TPA: hypothetical protein VFT05_04705 [Burkholderiaceae bacterium]|nr:hypothetical protein [Burkholderiaceae bacterium]